MYKSEGHMFKEAEHMFFYVPLREKYTYLNRKNGNSRQFFYEKALTARDVQF